ncbi:inactive TPR repeat-containing thioredoxin TTL3-like [Cajanus cajan]|uniref:inactive TPR repeat-containing thioredoxin TTL3-like n=1 Tax=Cajanus cajan TaxID=3821 RepID=UPI00098D7BF5|nr:inactive TPR repeat-containing thioredoxin TTL3-like [Cajanus cajan]
MYDCAIAISPGNTACRSNCAAALTAVRRLSNAARECLKAMKLDPAYVRAHKRLASLYLRFRQVENSRRHLCLHGIHEDQSEEQKLLLLEKHLNRCADARKFGDWERRLGNQKQPLLLEQIFCLSW